MQRQCGLCSALAEVFRRVMCIGASRRGSADSYYQELPPPQPVATHAQPRGSGISVETSGSHTVLIRIPDAVTSGGGGLVLDRRRLSESDWVLLEAIDCRPRTGRFLTMHKRRRKRLTTRQLSQEAPALLDDIHHGLVQCVLDRVWQWPFNAFTLDTVTGGRSLPVLCVHLFHWYGLVDHFNLDVVRVWKLFSLVEEGYHSTNPYHNSIHATDVTQAMHCFLQEEKIRKHLTPLETMASLIAAVTHDLDHPGVNQPFLIATSNHLAALYEDENTSVLENHHWRSAIGCLLESSLAAQLETSIRPELEQQISSLILATDITRQQEFLTKFKRYLDQDELDMSRAEDRHFILQIALKCADISNPCRPWDVSSKWAHKVCEEFFRQGDYERQLNLPVTSLCDRHSTSVPKIQTGFYRFVVAPLFEEWHRFLGTGLSDSMMTHLKGNQAKWETLVQQELADETKTEISEAEEIPEEEVSLHVSEECDVRRGSLDDRSSDMMPTPDSSLLQVDARVGRRHSMPLTVTRMPPIIQLPCTILRRESLPVADNRRRMTLGPILHLEEDEEELQQLSSLRSSCSSGGFQRSSDGGGGGGSGVDERPVSAENLLPEPSIASITTSKEATRLQSVLHASTGLAPPSRLPLTRQQTFPPIQPYVRQRYMSTTGEMVAADSSSSSSKSSVKRDSTDADMVPPDKHKLAKMARNGGQKENVDPRKDLDLSDAKARRSIPQSLSRRRGSAPVVRQHEELALQALQMTAGRRGSADAAALGTRTSVLKPLGLKENSSCLSMPRRSSLPYDLARHMHSHNNPSSLHPAGLAPGVDSENGGGGGCGGSGGGKSRSAVVRGGGKKVLKRRSSGGPETFAVWPPDQMTRRGSLPVDAIAGTSGGNGNGRGGGAPLL
ncbi:uncharacterized protein LOC111045382 isoform X3 [Nilaparvata lugens]|uniref:uncharacterized protein LOC111045382 isoform X3 n=1 Tax=Nilaparvata lugens TaxID=108931 RepID=UPI00193CACCE|nr:uncharacterized protein LOC111045382 isoform X3 [Nilaparvata lugens]